MILELFSMWLVWSIIVVPQLTEMIIHCCNVFLSCFMTSSNISVEPICWVLPWCYVFILSKTVALWNLQGKIIIIIFLHQRPLFMFICNFFWFLNIIILKRLLNTATIYAQKMQVHAWLLQLFSRIWNYKLQLIGLFNFNWSTWWRSYILCCLVICILLIMLPVVVSILRLPM
jgi:hypothetical protein